MCALKNTETMAAFPKLRLQFLTLHVRKTGKCHRRAWKAHWHFPNVARQELKVHRRPISFLTLHVRKTGSSETGKGIGETGSGRATEVPESSCSKSFWD